MVDYIFYKNSNSVKFISKTTFESIIIDIKTYISLAKILDNKSFNEIKALLSNQKVHIENDTYTIDYVPYQTAKITFDNFSRDMSLSEINTFLYINDKVSNPRLDEYLRMHKYHCSHQMYIMPNNEPLCKSLDLDMFGFLGNVVLSKYDKEKSFNLYHYILRFIQSFWGESSYKDNFDDYISLATNILIQNKFNECLKSIVNINNNLNWEYMVNPIKLTNYLMANETLQVKGF